jgi:hypothetical protein
MLQQIVGGHRASHVEQAVSQHARGACPAASRGSGFDAGEKIVQLIGSVGKLVPYDGKDLGFDEVLVAPV